MMARGKRNCLGTVFLYGAGANLQTAPQKTKRPVSLVYHIVNVVVPVRILLYESQGCGRAAHISSRVDSYSW